MSNNTSIAELLMCFGADFRADAIDLHMNIWYAVDVKPSARNFGFRTEKRLFLSTPHFVSDPMALSDFCADLQSCCPLCRPEPTRGTGTAHKQQRYETMLEHIVEATICVLQEIIFV